MEPIDEAYTLIKNVFSPVPVDHLDKFMEKARNGNDEDKFFLAHMMYDHVDRSSDWGKSPFTWNPDDRIKIKQLLLSYVEEIAERGYPRAMSFAACAYSNGDSGNGPDLAKAFEWAVKGEQAGDAIAAKIRPGLEADLARSKEQNGPAP